MQAPWSAKHVPPFTPYVPGAALICVGPLPKNPTTQPPLDRSCGSAFDAARKPPLKNYGEGCSTKSRDKHRSGIRRFGYDPDGVFTLERIHTDSQSAIHAAFKRRLDESTLRRNYNRPQQLDRHLDGATSGRWSRRRTGHSYAQAAHTQVSSTAFACNRSKRTENVSTWMRFGSEQCGH